MCRPLLLIYRSFGSAPEMMWGTSRISCILGRMRRCKICHTAITPARQAALPTTTTCVNCSNEAPVKGYMTWEHKTAPVFQVVTPTQHQWLQSRDRKGMRSGLPMGSRGSSAPLATTPVSSVAILPVAYTPAPETSNAGQSLVPMATKCPHQDRPQVSSAGKCLECALAYYQVRIDINKQVAAKKRLGLS